ncbi:MAG: SatD family protein [Terracidiphilus sp.]
MAVIGDLVASRLLASAERNSVQRALRTLLDRLNAANAVSIRSGFTIALGDQFEGLLSPEQAHRILPDLAWELDEAIPQCQVRLGFGLGGISTEIVNQPGLVDGPAFHRARAAIDLAKRRKRMGGVFQGFGEPYDGILNGLARLLHAHRSRWSQQQRRLAAQLRRDAMQSEAAIALEISKQAVSAYAKAAGWAAYKEGEDALRLAIRLACTNSTGEREERP